MDVPSTDPQPDIHEPFTKAERIQQLSEIDHDITTLLTSTSRAIQSLAAPIPEPDPTAQTESFKTSMNSFLSALHSVDVRLKRQILALEEAGIISLKSRDQLPTKDAVGGSAVGVGGGIGGAGSGASGKAGAVEASLEPTGTGTIGSLDVGWLNARGGKVERDMEVELWERARSHLEGVVAGAAAAASGEGAGGDVTVNGGELPSSDDAVGGHGDEMQE